MILKNLRALRTQHKLSQAAVAECTGIGLELYVRYEGGRHLPRLNTVIALADFFGCSLDFLVGRTASNGSFPTNLSDHPRPSTRLAAPLVRHRRIPEERIER